MEFFVSSLTAVANLILGLFTYLKNPKSATNKLFAFLTLQISLWAITNYFSLHASTEALTLFWIRTVMFIVSALGPTIFLLIKAFPERSTNLPKYVIYAVWFFTGLTAILAISQFMFISVSIIDGNIQPVPGPAIFIFAVNFLGFLGAAFITLGRKYKKSTGLERVQIKYLLLGIILTFTLIAITNFIFVVLMNVSSFVIFGPLFTLILVGFISYAIVKHRFLDIKLVVARSVAYSLLLLILGTLYASGLFVVGTFIVKEPTSINNLITSTVLALIIAFTFQPLRRYLERVTSKIFYRDRYDSHLLLSKLGHIMASTLRLESLVELVLKELMDQMKIARGLIVTTQYKSVIWAKGVGYKEYSEFYEKEVYSLIKSSYNKRGEHLLVFEELSESKRKEIMRKHNLTVILPLVIKDKIIGAVVFGEKSSGDIYSSEDINLLKIIAPEMAVAVRNAQSYEEIRKFNITLRKEINKATEKLRRANQRLRALDKLKDEFVSVTSHELRTPMTAVKSYLWMVLHKSRGKLDKKGEEYLNRAYISTQRTINLVNDMLDVSRIEGGRFEIKKDKVNIVKIARNVASELKFKAEEKKIALTVGDGEIPKALADKEKIQQVFFNLLGNAVKFTPKGGKITVSFAKKNSYVQARISDTGQGISHEDQKRLFIKFGRLENSLVSMGETGGTGLGLYISKQIIEMHGGRIWVESEVSKGATFIFTLPVGE
jgi:signal transduction histidine kinase